MYWTAMEKFELKCQPRFDGDSLHAEFINLIRTAQPTAAQLDHYLSPDRVHYISKEDAMRMTHAQVLCSHREDVRLYNNAALHQLFSADQVVEVPMYSDAWKEPTMQEWLSKPRFHELTHVAIGARVALTANIDVLEVSMWTRGVPICGTPGSTY